MSSSTSKQGKLLIDRKIVASAATVFDTTKTVTILEVAYSSKELAAVFEENIGYLDAVDAARKQYLAAVAAWKHNEAEVGKIRSGFRSYLVSRYGASSQNLADFGFKPRAPRAVTAQKKAAAVEKAKATREARHILGKRQRAEIQAPAAPPPVATAPSPAASAPTTAGTTTAPTVNGSGANGAAQ